MHHASDKPTLRKKENKKASSFLSWIGFREKKLEWVRKPKTPAFPSCNRFGHHPTNVTQVKNNPL